MGKKFKKELEAEQSKLEDEVKIAVKKKQGILLGDSVHGISPFILKTEYFKNLFE